MKRSDLAIRLMLADEAEQQTLLAQHVGQLDLDLAYALKEACYSAWASDPPRAVVAAAALAKLAGRLSHPEVDALAAWTAGIAALIEGRLELALLRLDEAEAGFKTLNKPHTAASTQVSKLIALAMLGRYDEALACGLRARDVFVAYGDLLAAGKIEQNLGNIYFRRDRYQEAERLYRLARERFAMSGDTGQLAQIDNCLATALASQHRFREAAQIYEQARACAEAAGQELTLAEIEANRGSLALFQGQYDRALDDLERSRRRYAKLGLPHKSALAEQELADAYLELNLAPEASAIYTRIVPLFAELGMRAEQARALAYHGRAMLLLGRTDAARSLLAEARVLYAAEGNAVGEAMVTLTEAQLYQAQGRHSEAAAAAAQAEPPFEAVGAWGRLLLTRWLRGEAVRAQGRFPEAQALLQAALREAEQQSLPQIAQLCWTSLGVLAAQSGDLKAAEAALQRAVTLIETLRAPLPAEEFRTAFIADKLIPYVELVRLCLADGRAERVEEALGYVERARSRTLVETLRGALSALPKPQDSFEAELLERLEALREELNWLYSRINHPDGGSASRGVATRASLYAAVRERESAMLEMTRQLRLRSQRKFISSEPLDIAQLKHSLGDHTALVEYFGLDDELLAFVVTGGGVEAIRHLGRASEVRALLEQFQFQLGALRHGAERLRLHLSQLARRAQRPLSALYDRLLRPLEGRLGARRLLIAPHRELHYIPFHALHDGAAYVIERREVCYAPSADVLHHCLARQRRALQQAVLLGVADAQAPRVHDEVVALAPLFPRAVTLLGEQATRTALQAQSPSADVLHLACHGRFRSDNPLFSSLRLADGWLTVRDVYRLALNCELVTLSACETGMSAVAPGDELIGLARGFLSAGAPSLVVSLWNVDDAATADLMADFYDRLLAGDCPAAALRYAQLQRLRQQPHPFFWSPFILLGRW